MTCLLRPEGEQGRGKVSQYVHVRARGTAMDRGNVSISLCDADKHVQTLMATENMQFTNTVQEARHDVEGPRRPRHAHELVAKELNKQEID